MSNFKEYLKANGKDHYSRILAVKIVDKLEVFTSKNVSKQELIEMVSDVIKGHLGK